MRGALRQRQIYNINGKNVIAYIPTEIKYQDLKTVYDLCNQFFAGDQFFYTKEQVKELKKDTNNIFLNKSN